MSFTPQQIEAINKVAQAWANQTRLSLKASAKGSISSSLRMQNRYEYGFIYAITFKFPRYGVFVEMGVFGGLTRKEAAEKGKLRPQPWFNPVIISGLNDLGNNLSKVTADLVLGETNKALIKTEKNG